MTNDYRRVHEALDDLLVDKVHQIEKLPVDSAPLFLLLTVIPDIVGFAFCNEDSKASLAQALEQFKSLYVTYSTQWANCDLTLVLCRTDANQDQNASWTEIELDPYFCRKFVIDLTKDPQADLKNLPFIPLRPDKVVGFERPPSAHTFLVDRGVRPWLADALVIPHKLSEIKIVEQCLALTDGVPPLRSPEIVKSKRTSPDRQTSVRLTSLEITNFRAYRKSQVFDLDANLIVMYGPNGLGKSSSFDAIDFLCTGGITRFDERFGRRTERLVASIKHLDAREEDTSVKANLTVNGNPVQLQRDLHARTRAIMNGVPSDTIKILTSLVGGGDETSDMRVDNLIRLFRATHLFGQEYQSLTFGLRDESRLSEDTVSRMLAFQDYVEAINKAMKISNFLERKREECNSEISILDDLLQSKQAQLNEFSVVTKAVRTPQSIELVGKKLILRIAREAGLGPDVSRDISQESARSWRALLEAKVAEETTRLATARFVEVELPDLPILEASLRTNQNKLTETKKKALEIETAQVAANLALDSIKSEFSEALKREQELNLQLENLNWLSDNGRRHRELNREINRREIEIRQKESSLKVFENAMSGLKTEEAIDLKSIAELEAEARNLENNLSAIKDLEKGLQDWSGVRDRLNEITALLHLGESELRTNHDETSKKKKKLGQLTVHHQDLERAVENHERTISDFQRLLESIKELVSDNTCPVCGAVHQSRWALLTEISHRIGTLSPGVEELRKRERLARGKVEELRREISRLEIKNNSAEGYMSTLREEFETLQLPINEHLKKGADLGVQANNRAALSETKAELTKRAETIRQQLDLERDFVAQRRDGIKALYKQQEVEKQDLGSVVRDMDSLSDKINNIEKTALSRGLSISESPESIRDSYSTLGNELSELHDQQRQRKPHIQKLERESSQAAGQLDTLNRLLRVLDKRISEFTGRIETFDKELAKIGLNREIVAARLQPTIEQTTKRLAILESMCEEVKNFELALDEAQTTAQLAKLNNEVEDLTRRHSEISKRRQALADWQSYFDKLRTGLERIRKQSLEKYVDMYGPLTSSIQSRLRTVYGFGDLQLKQEKAGIAVSVRRRDDKQIFPSDYFSESQIQTVTLSLFLSAVLTQTWSSFAPILLDDPVTHFDDLNAYSFLDIIRGLIDKPGEGHQFILSTCEERLYRLMRQRFAKLQTRTIYYEFDSIGEDGPVIRQN